MKSRFCSVRVPSRFGADSLTPAPCTSTIAATESAATRSWIENRSRFGIAGSGIPVGIAPFPATVATPASNAAAIAVGTIRARSAPTFDNRVGRSRTTIAIAARPTSRVGTSIDLGCSTTEAAFWIARVPVASARVPVRSGIWPSTMFTATPERNPTMTECDTKRV